MDVPIENTVSGFVTLTDNNPGTIFPAGTGLAYHVTGGWITNAHATVATEVELLCGGTIQAKAYLPAAGGRLEIVTGGAMKGTKGGAWTARCVTTGSNVTVNLFAFKSFTI
jgi:hypothetical protein